MCFITIYTGKQHTQISIHFEFWECETRRQQRQGVGGAISGCSVLGPNLWSGGCAGAGGQSVGSSGHATLWLVKLWAGLGQRPSLTRLSGILPSHPPPKFVRGLCPWQILFTNFEGRCLRAFSTLGGVHTCMQLHTISKQCGGLRPSWPWLRLLAGVLWHSPSWAHFFFFGLGSVFGGSPSGDCAAFFAA